MPGYPIVDAPELVAPLDQHLMSNRQMYRHAKPAGARRVHLELLTGDLYRLDGLAFPLTRVRSAVNLAIEVPLGVNAVFTSRPDGVQWLPDGVLEVKVAPRWRELGNWSIPVEMNANGGTFAAGSRLWFAPTETLGLVSSTIPIYFDTSGLKALRVDAYSGGAAWGTKQVTAHVMGSANPVFSAATGTYLTGQNSGEAGVTLPLNFSHEVALRGLFGVGPDPAGASLSYIACCLYFSGNAFTAADFAGQSRFVLWGLADV